MTIIHFTGMRANKYGGIEKFFVELATQLHSKNYNLILVYEEMPTSEKYIKDLNAKNVKIEIIKTKNASIINSFFRIVKLLRIYRPDIIHTHFDPTSYIVLIISAFLGYKVRIKNMHGMLYTGIRKTNVKSKSELPLKTILLKLIMYKFSTHIFSVSDGIKRQFIDIFNIERDSKIECLYLGVNSSEFLDVNKVKCELGIREDVLVISCIAFHDKVKGIDVLLNAVSLLNSRDENIKFKVLLVGGGSDRNTMELKELAANLYIEDKIQWLGIRNDVSNILAISDIYCQPSRSEGISLSLMEAAINGLPLIATNTGGIPEIVEHKNTGLLVEVDDFTAMSYGLEELIKNTAIREEFGINAKRMAIEKFQSSIQVEKLIRKYEQFVKI